MGLRALLNSAAALAVAAGARAATIHVSPCGDDSWSGATITCAGPNGPKRTIGAALAAAQSGDEISVAAGPYAGIGNTNLIIQTSGIRLFGDAGGEVVIDGENSATGIAVSMATGVTPQRLTFRNCVAVRGRAVSLLNTDATVRDCKSQDCRATGSAAADGGGALFASFATPTIEDCQFVNNSATAAGGAAYFLGAGGHMSNCVFSRNTAESIGSNNCGGDANRDGRFDNFDIDPFMTCLLNFGCP